MDSRTGKMISEEAFNSLSPEEKQYYINLSNDTKEILEERDRKYEMQMQELEQENEVKRLSKNSMRNKPCPCGSGKKYKKCCLHTLA